MGSNVTFATVQEYKEAIINIEENLVPHPECCIYRVPKVLRETNEKAYTPQVISIGPLHHDKQDLAYMEKQKIRYKREFRERTHPWILEDFVRFIRDHEQCIRNCYEEISDFHQSLEFVTMILYDAVFIIEFFLKNIEVNESKRNQLKNEEDIWSDLLLLENQIPYFVLKYLYDSAFGNHRNYLPFNELSCISVVRLTDFKVSALNLEDDEDEIKFKHFTDLQRFVLTNGYSRPPTTGSTSDLRCAIKLKKSGMKFKHVDGGQCLVDIKFEKRKRRAPFQWLEEHELKIPKLEVKDRTESVVRNLMALEQCHYPRETHVCSYIYLMDRLIDNREDVNLLVDKGIISDSLGGDTAQISNMFNKLCTNIYRSDLLSYDDVEKLKEYYKSPWNNAKTTLKMVYFSNPWRGAGTLAAIVLLLFTIGQTICSILQVVWI